LGEFFISTMSATGPTHIVFGFINLIIRN
jgi:hypothetical protein